MLCQHSDVTSNLYDLIKMRREREIIKLIQQLESDVLSAVLTQLVEENDRESLDFLLDKCNIDLQVMMIAAAKVGHIDLLSYFLHINPLLRDAEQIYSVVLRAAIDGRQFELLNHLLNEYTNKTNLRECAITLLHTLNGAGTDYKQSLLIFSCIDNPDLRQELINAGKNALAQGGMMDFSDMNYFSKLESVGKKLSGTVPVLRAFIENNQLDYGQFRILLSLNISTRIWLTQGKQIITGLTRHGESVNENVAVEQQLPPLPAELYLLITALSLGLSIERAANLRAAFNNQVCDSLIAHNRSRLGPLSYFSIFTRAFETEARERCEQRISLHRY